MTNSTLPISEMSLAGNSIHFVIKPSKLCNLRCTYCYEFAFLDDRRRISMDQMEVMFSTIADYADREGLDSVGFTWHGGEPFLLPIGVYEEIADLQRKLLPHVKVDNSVQTNMTILTDDHIDFIKTRGFFRSIGVSFDVLGNKRVDKRGQPTAQRVLRNIQRLSDENIEFGTICVLARSNVASAASLFRFFDDLNIDCRFLPFYRGTDATGRC